MIDPPQVSVARIGRRFYWVVYRSTSAGIVRIFDGFADSRESAPATFRSLVEARALALALTEGAT
jgi:hypothetical protein